MTASYKYILFMCIAAIVLAGCSSSKVGSGKISPLEVEILKATYPKYVLGYRNGSIVMANNIRIVFDDKKQKTHDQLINNADIQDMFTPKYRKGEIDLVLAKNDDPGRYRNEEFYKTMYGYNEEEVRKNLTTISWCPKLVNQQLLVTTINGVDKQFLKVSAELDEHPEWAQYINAVGTFNWRKIRGSKMQSAHSFGIAIDINTSYSSYWKSDDRDADENTDIGSYENQIPQGIVDIFEKHGFIWGGKWYHYDSMHFEYRPELLQ